MASNGAYEAVLYKGDAGVNPQRENALTSEKQKYWAAQGQYPFAQEGAGTAPNNTPTPTSQPTQQPAAPAGAAPAPAPTFSQLQDQGYARPAPPTISPTLSMPGPSPFPGITTGGGGNSSTTWSAGGAGATGAMNPDLQAQINALIANPSAYTDEQFSANVLRKGQDIDDEFNLQRQQLKEDMVRRGLSESSIYGGRLADSQVGQRTAKASLVSDLAEQRARQLDEAKRAALGLGLQGETLGIDRQRLGLEGQRVGVEGQRLALDQERARLDAFMDQERLRLEREVQSGRLSQDQARLELDKIRQQSDEQFRQSELDWNKERYGTEDAWRRENELYQRDRDTKSDEFRDQSFDWTKQTWQAGFEADLMRLLGIDVTKWGSPS